MRHGQIKAEDSFTKVDLAAVWRASARAAPFPLPDIGQASGAASSAPTPATPDVPAALGWLIVASYAALLGSFALATVASSHSMFMVVICGFFLVVYFTVPWLLLQQEPNAGPRPSFDRFMSHGMETFTGHSSGGAALVQMLLVPVLLTFGALAMAVIAAIYL